MKILLDTCVWGGARTNLEVAGHDVIWAGDWPEDPGDEEILARAHKEDFGEIAIVHKTKHSGILRLVNFSARQQGLICLRVIDTYGNELQSGAIVTAEPGHLRIRPPDEKLKDG